MVGLGDRYLVTKLGIQHVLDLGCGTASMLIKLAARCHEFRGWGIDANPWLCKYATKRIAAAHLQRRGTIFEGDCRALSSVIPAQVIAGVQALTASGVINEFFAKGAASAIAWVRDLRKVFPGRRMLIADYYSQVGVHDKGPQGLLRCTTSSRLSAVRGSLQRRLRTWKEIYSAVPACESISAVEQSGIHALV